MFAIVRKDLEMPAGKLAAQAGHAYTDSIAQADSEVVAAYRNAATGGSKVALKAKNEFALIRAYNEAKEAGLPCSIIVDRNHILPPHFDGSPIITALGIGPCKHSEAKQITKRYQLC